MCLFWLVLKVTTVNKKHRYVLCYMSWKPGKQSVLRCWAGKKGEGKKNPRKGRGAGAARVCSVTGSVCWCSSHWQERSVAQSSPTSPRAVPRDLGWVLRGVAAASPCSFFPGALPVACPWVCAPPYADFCSIPSVSYLRALMHMFWRWPPWLWVAADGKPSGCHRLYWC